MGHGTVFGVVGIGNLSIGIFFQEPIRGEHVYARHQIAVGAEFDEVVYLVIKKGKIVLVFSYPEGVFEGVSGTEAGEKFDPDLLKMACFRGFDQSLPEEEGRDWCVVFAKAGDVVYGLNRKWIHVIDTLVMDLRFVFNVYPGGEKGNYIFAVFSCIFEIGTVVLRLFLP